MKPLSSATLLSGAVTSLVAGAVFLYVGLRFLNRPAHVRTRSAHLAFVVWWLGVASFVLLWNGLMPILVVGGIERLGVHVALRYASYLGLCVGIACLVYYLLYLFMGHKWLRYPVFSFYAVVFLLLAYLVATSDPVGLDVRRWRVTLDYRTPLGGAYLVLLSLLILPTTVGGFAYFVLRFKTDDPLMRFRVTLVSWSIIVWGLSSLLARILEYDWWQVFTRSGIGLIAALVIWFAYETPAGVRKRLGAVRPAEPPGSTAVPEVSEGQRRRRRRDRREKELEIQWRMRELV